MAYHTEKKRLSVQRERELLLEELRSKNEILNFVSERDELTQIKNRRGFMEQAMEMNHVYKNRKAIIMFADMDGLKQINDNYGHAAGDIAICACADILKKAMVEIYDVFEKNNMKSKMLLQVHDEHIFNVYNDEIDRVKKIVHDIMTNVFELSVPLEVDIETGNN